jgi:hypothetical protein
MRRVLRFCLSVLMWICVLMACRCSEKPLWHSVGRTNLFDEGRRVLYALLAADFTFNFVTFEIEINAYLKYVLKFN